MKIHINAKMFKCTICDTQFTKSSNLVRHLFSHNENRKYICYICGKGYYRSDNLKRYFKLHTNVKKKFLYFIFS